MDSSLAEQQHWALQLVPGPSAFVAYKSRVEHDRTTATDRHSIESAAIGTGCSRDGITNRYQTASTRTAHCPLWTIHDEHDYQGGRFEYRLSFAPSEGRLWGTSIGNAGEGRYASRIVCFSIHPVQWDTTRLCSQSTTTNWNHLHRCQTTLGRIP